MTTMNLIRLGIPKGRMYNQTAALLDGAGIKLRHGTRDYRPVSDHHNIEAKILKPQNIIEMLQAGSRDIGFAGADWVAELGADVVELLDTGFDAVRLVAAAPKALLEGSALPLRPLRVASEYANLTAGWIARRGMGDSFVRSYGATEVFPPEDADVVTDITASGATLRANELEIVDDLMVSSTRLYANRQAFESSKRDAIEGFALLLRSVLDARERVMLEMNVPSDRLESLSAMLPCMREPTVSPLHHSAGFAVKVAVPRKDVATLIPRIKAAGGSDIVIMELAQIVA